MADWSDNFSFLPIGAAIQAFKIDGHNIVLGFDEPKDYVIEENPYFGETIGRVANRIAGARILSLNGRSYELSANNGGNTLHGGHAGWGKKQFDGPVKVTRGGREALRFSYHSPDGDEGFPGAVLLNVWYYPEIIRADGKDKTVSLEIEYEVELVDNLVEETVINVCNHSYFNITGAGTIKDTAVTLATALHQVKDENDLPTGEITTYPGIVQDEEFVLGAEQPDIDHCFIMNDKPASVPLDTRSQPLRKLCTLRQPGTGVMLEAFSTEPAFQFYTGRFINVPATNGQPARGPRSGLCIETCRYVNAINVDQWRSMVVLRRGQTYGSRTMYRASIT